MPGTVLLQLGAHDRALLLRCALAQDAPRRARLFWLGITHLGGTGPSLLAAGLPLLACCRLQWAAKVAVLSLVISHLVVQFLKRTVVRARPGAVERTTALVSPPDRFSLPSGHSAASMSVALAYSIFYPVLAAPLLLLAFLVGFSRVRLRVHYPSDVIVGQLIAAFTVTVVALAS